MPTQAYRRIRLSRTKTGPALHTLVDREDYERLRRVYWSLTSRGYVTAKIDGKSVLMHRHIFGLEVGDPRIVDHINHDQLDNRRRNLRVGGPGENMQNKLPYGKSGVMGVHAFRDRWKVEVVVNGVKHYLGCFTDAEEAGEVARAFRAEHLPFSVEAREARSAEGEQE